MDLHELDTLTIQYNTLDKKLDKILELLYTKGDYKTGTVEEPIDPGLEHIIEQVQTED